MTIDNSECLIRFEGHGVQFDYPGFWELTEEHDGKDVIITVSADGTCFWVLRILADNPRADEVVNSCLEALQEEYDEAEVEVVSTTLAQLPAYCREVGFSCFELLNSVSLTSVQASGMTLLVWWQGTDHELGELRPLFEQVTQSVRILSTPSRLGHVE
jgi:hypothetical protein